VLTCRETFYSAIAMGRFVIGIIESKLMRFFHRASVTSCPRLLNEWIRCAAPEFDSAFLAIPPDPASAGLTASPHAPRIRSGRAAPNADRLPDRRVKDRSHPNRAAVEVALIATLARRHGIA
jgi:hypothetical protein